MSHICDTHTHTHTHTLTHTQENYGRRSPSECAQRVKELYKELNIEKVYTDHEESSYQTLMKVIDEQAAAVSLPKGMFVEFANRIYKRNA